MKYEKMKNERLLAHDKRVTLWMNQMNKIHMYVSSRHEARVRPVLILPLGANFGTQG
jgi:hypothetical protein